MNELEDYYIRNLYPLQDGILNIVKELKLPFYLTGGTALSRVYFSYRYSDDLDLFVNNDINFNKYVESFYKHLITHHQSGQIELNHKKILRTEFHTQFFVTKDEAELKIDLINDVAPHFGNFIYHDKLGKVDNLKNILSNKLSAIFRYEVKAIVDLWIICKNFAFSYEEIINEAKIKEAGVEPIAIYEIISSFPLNKLNFIKWIKQPNIDEFKDDIHTIAEDIFYGRKNSLAI